MDNFPNVNDYRNLLVSETMKTLGYVNRHSKGVLRVQTELQENGNGLPEYDFSYQTAVCVIEHKSANAFGTSMTENEGKRSEMTQSEEKRSLNMFPTMTIKNVLDVIRLNRKAQYSWLADNLGVSEATVKRAIQWLKDNGYMPKEHSKIKGDWQLLK